ncbi:aldo/keto reductase [Bifidobacterium thermophilum]|uniref:aldo/keto reductase n=1 Tax=Bifidobacterium thermophilum TaxID=33905 RepID=UPI003099E758
MPSSTNATGISTYKPSPDRYETMSYRRSGRSGLKLPAISLGFWHNFGDFSSYDTMKHLCFTAFDHGITHFDLANNYGPEPGSAERNAGRILHDYFGAHRDELVISTKAGFDMWPGPYGDHGSRKYLLTSLDQSLTRLGLDYVDIFYHHCPDPDTPLEETMGALAQAVVSGKALYVGLSNYDGQRLEAAAAILDELHVPFIIAQNRYNILDRTVEHNGLLDAVSRLGKGLITYSPLDQGLLTDRYLDGIPADSRVARDGRFLTEADVARTHDAIVALNTIAAARGQSLADMALAWLLRKSEVTSVLVGASRPQQLLDSIGALNGPDFTDDELAAIDRIASDGR